MRLFLSSYRAGDCADRLVELFGQGAKVAVISNAKDYKSDVERKQSIEASVAYLRELGFEANELDLRRYFDKRENWSNYLQAYDAIWLAGGNTFVLRRALAKVGIDSAIVDLVKAGKLAYGGESAGAIMATPDFTGVQFGDDPDVLPAGYLEPTPWQGLGLVDYDIVPHFRSEWAGAEKMIATLQKESKNFKKLTDNQVIVVDGEHQEFLG